MNVLRVPRESWVSLSKDLSGQPNINQSRVRPEQLAQIHKNGRAVVLMKDKRIYGFAALWPTLSDAWLELGTVFVSDAHAGQGYAHIMFNRLFELSKSLKKSVFLTARDPKMHKIAGGAEWVCPENWKDAPCACAIDPGRAMDDHRKLFYFHQPAS